MRYFIQYPAGTSELVVDALSNFVDDFSVHYQDDSAAIFDSTSSAEQVAKIPFAKNAFIVIAATPRKDVDQSARRLSSLLGREAFPALPARTPGFRLMAHIDGELSSIAPAVRADIEGMVSSRTGLRVEPRGMCQEYWVVGRLDMRELLFCARLPKTARPKKSPGAVSHELSSMLVLASQPGPQDVYLDPFAGSGSFVWARLDMPAREIIYSDTDIDAHRGGFPGEPARDERVRFLSEDALTLPSIPDGAVDVVVTDPPWGEHEELPFPPEEFARAVAKSLARVLRPETGRLVLLSSRRGADAYRDGLGAAGFVVDAAHEILVNGHPATVFVAGRSSSAVADAAEGARRPSAPSKPLLLGMGTYRRAMGRFSR